MAQKKRNTNPGLGDADGKRGGAVLPRFDSASIERVRVSQRDSARASPPRDEVPPSEPPKSKRTTTRSFESDPPEGSADPERAERSVDKRSWEPESPTGTRPRKATRPPVQVDDVGAAAVRIAGARRENAPKLLASRSSLARAPIDSRAAFLLSMVDGQNTIEALVDMTGMPIDEVRGTLERCARLGLIELP